MRALGRPGCSLRVLRCARNPGVGHRLDASRPSLRALLARGTPLRVLSLAHCGLGDAGFLSLAEGLATSVSLEELDLGSNGATADGCRALAVSLAAGGAPRLAVLRLRMNAAGPAGCVALCGALASRPAAAASAAAASVGDGFELDLCSNKVGGVGAAAVLGLPNLAHANLMDCDLADEGTENMVAAMRANVGALGKTLRGLNVCGNDLGDDGAVALCRVLGDMFPVDGGDGDGGRRCDVKFVLGIGANARLGEATKVAAEALMHGRRGFQVAQDKTGGGDGDGEAGPGVGGDSKDDDAQFAQMLQMAGRGAAAMKTKN